MEKGWQTEHGEGTYTVHEIPPEGWHWVVRLPSGVVARGPYKTRLGADRAAWNCIRRWEHDAAQAAVWRAHGR